MAKKTNLARRHNEFKVKHPKRMKDAKIVIVLVVLSIVLSFINEITRGLAFFLIVIAFIISLRFNFNYNRFMKSNK